MHQCRGSLLFPEGSIEQSTTMSFGGDIIAAVTGGTGSPQRGTPGRIRSSLNFTHRDVR
jgi:hypothetical protein